MRLPSRPVVGALLWIAVFGTAARCQAQTVGENPPGTPAPIEAGTTKTDAPTKNAFGVQALTKGAQLGKEVTSRYEIGMIITALGGPCTGIYGTMPVPTDWPEQTVREVSHDLSPLVQAVEHRMIGGTVKQMLIGMPVIPGGVEAKATITLEIRRFSQLPPPDTTIFVLPNDKKIAKDVRQYLLPSPLIETTHPKIRAAAKELMTAHQDDSAWEKVEAIYDWTREKVKYVNGPIKGAMRALNDGTGDCEELSSLFIAVCRASGIPARIVWVPEHCYPEFYLEDAEGKGYWFPCQAAGTREFGGITEHRPILQKGDNFQVPEKKERMRYVAEYLTGKGGNPKVKFIRAMLDSQN